MPRMVITTTIQMFLMFLISLVTESHSDSESDFRHYGESGEDG